MSDSISEGFRLARCTCKAAIDSFARTSLIGMRRWLQNHVFTLSTSPTLHSQNLCILFSCPSPPIEGSLRPRRDYYGWHGPRDKHQPDPDGDQRPKPPPHRLQQGRPASIGRHQRAREALRGSRERRALGHSRHANAMTAGVGVITGGLHTPTVYEYLGRTRKCNGGAN